MVWSVAFSPDGSRIASASAIQATTTPPVTPGRGGVVQLWDATNVISSKTLPVISSVDGSALSLAFSPDGQYLAFGLMGARICVWNTRRNESQIYSPQSPNDVDSIRSIAFSPDGRWLACACTSFVVRIWKQVAEGDTVSWTPSAPLTGHTRFVNTVAFSPTMSILVSGSSDQTIRLWNTENWEPGNVLPLQSSSVWAVAFTNDGSRMASAASMVGGERTGTVQVWDTTGTSWSSQTAEEKSTAYSLPFSPGGMHLAIGTNLRNPTTKAIRVWTRGQGSEGETWTMRDEKLMHEGVITSSAFSPDGSLLVSGSTDGLIRVWDMTWLRQPGA